MSDNTLLFRPRDDADLRTGIRAFYSKVVGSPSQDEPIVIKLPTRGWLSAAALNMLLTFIEAIQVGKPTARIYVDIFDYEDAESILSQSTDHTLDADGMSWLTRRLVFYEAMGLVNLLRQRNVLVRPTGKGIEKIQEILQAHKNKSSFLHSSRMLPLTPLVESEEDQYALTTRIKTLTHILYRNLYARIDIGDLEEASKQIMFEIVKNIYQHSNLPKDYTSRARGFASAQINKYPLIDNREFPQALIQSTLETIRKSITGKKWCWLSIAINDFGVGIVDKVRRFLEGRFTVAERIQVGRLLLSSEE